jgi:hypothetical protein
VEGREWRRESERDVRQGEMRRKSIKRARSFWGNVRSERPLSMYGGSCYWGKELDEGLE